MQLTPSERKLINLETSYRVERTGCGTFAVFCALPLLYGIGSTILGLFKFHDHLDVYMSGILKADWSSLFPLLTLVLMFSFLAYRAQSKLTLIDHLKHHLETEPSEPAAGQKSDRVRVSA